MKSTNPLTYVKPALVQMATYRLDLFIVKRYSVAGGQKDSYDKQNSFWRESYLQEVKQLA
jgi:hypothetical protein